MSKQHELTLNQQITVGGKTITVKRIGSHKQSGGPRVPVVVVEVDDGEGAASDGAGARFPEFP